jgi:hypothetical protein
MTWTPATQQSETWTLEAQPTRGFSPNGFSHRPNFDTGKSSGIWDAQTKQAETWTAE